MSAGEEIYLPDVMDVDTEGYDASDPGVEAFREELARLEKEWSDESTLEDIENCVREMEAILAQLGTDPLWISGIRLRCIPRRDGSAVELLTYDTGAELRAMRVVDDAPQTSSHRHPMRGGGGLPICPDSLAGEVLEQLPQEQQTGDKLLEIARKNERAYERYRELQRLLGRLATADSPAQG